MPYVRLKQGRRHIAKGGYTYTGGMQFHITPEELASFGDKFEVLPDPEAETNTDEATQQIASSVDKETLVTALRNRYGLTAKYADLLVDAGYDSESIINNTNDEDLLLVVSPNILKKLRS